jgi:hypothetical protein
VPAGRWEQYGDDRLGDVLDLFERPTCRGCPAVAHRLTQRRGRTVRHYPEDVLQLVVAELTVDEQPSRGDAPVCDLHGSTAQGRSARGAAKGGPVVGHDDVGDPRITDVDRAVPEERPWKDRPVEAGSPPDPIADLVVEPGYGLLRNGKAP